MNFRKLVIFDFETDGKKPQECNPVQLAATVLDARKLTRVAGGKFTTNMRPPGIEDRETYLTDSVQDTVRWHAKNYDCTSDEILDKWEAAPTQKHAWENFVNFIDRFNPKKTMFTAPVPGGANIRNFDLIIVDRMNALHNNGKDIFFRRDRLDVMELAFYWFEGLDEPKSYSMDSLRDFFGISKAGGHDAFKDVEDCENIIRRFLKLHRQVATNVKFRGAFATGSKSENFRT